MEIFVQFLNYAKFWINFLFLFLFFSCEFKKSVCKAENFGHSFEARLLKIVIV